MRRASQKCSIEEIISIVRVYVAVRGGEKNPAGVPRLLPRIRAAKYSGVVRAAGEPAVAAKAVIRRCRNAVQKQAGKPQAGRTRRWCRAKTRQILWPDCCLLGRREGKCLKL